MVTTPEPPLFEISIGLIQHLNEALRCWQNLVGDQSDHDERISRDALTITEQKQFLRNVILDGRLIVATNRKDEMIGIATISIDQNMLDNSSSIWNISDVWVHPLFRRNGIATKLVAKCEEIAESRGATEIRLHVYATNQPAAMMYGRLGYSTIVRTMSRKLY